MTYLGTFEIRDEAGRVYRGASIELLEAALDAVLTLEELVGQVTILEALAVNA